MKSRTLLIIILMIMLVLPGCSVSRTTSNDALKITNDDEKIILEYLDKNTNDIASPTKGKMYSSFLLLGTSKDKIYIWVAKVEYLIMNGNVTDEGGNAVSLPVVLNVKKNGKSLSIISHKYPEEGEDNGKSTKKLFPSDIKFPGNDELLKLNEITKTRAEENLKK